MVKENLARLPELKKLEERVNSLGGIDKIEALVNNLGGMDEVRKILSGQTQQVSTSPTPSIFLPETKTVTVPDLIETFITKDHFTSEEGIWTSSDFDREFRDMTVAPRRGYDLTARTLKMPANDTTILKELGDPEGTKVETDLYTLHNLVMAQKSGRRGLLKVDGYVNVFHMRNNEGRLRAVYVGRDGGEWRAFVCSVSYPGGWGDGGQVISRNS
jgi:hypothetical protein